MGKELKNQLRLRFDAKDFASLPRRPGVYIMRGPRGGILYVGKATRLRDRIRSYRNVNPKKVGSNIRRMLERVEEISWEEFPTEKLAYERELELIRALNPPYNIRDAWLEDYFFIGLRRRKQSKRQGVDRESLDFHLTSDENAATEYELFGCFPGRRKVKHGYSALLRLLYACTNERERFSFPARLARPSPAYKASLNLPEARRWERLLILFLSARSPRLLKTLVNHLLANMTLPEYIRPGLQRDLKSLIEFKTTCIEFRKRYGIQKDGALTHKELRLSIRQSIKSRGTFASLKASAELVSL